MHSMMLKEECTFDLLMDASLQQSPTQRMDNMEDIAET